MKYINDEIKALAFDFILKKTMCGWRFQGHTIEEDSYGELMLTFNFSTESDNKVYSQSCIGLSDDDAPYAKENLERWIKQVKKPYEKNTTENN